MELLGILKRLFDFNKDFYDNRFTLHSLNLEEMIQDDLERERQDKTGRPEFIGVQYTDMRSSTFVNILYPYNVHWFGIWGGFQTIVDYVRTYPALLHIAMLLGIF
jgi:hypothetical protein